MRWAITPAGVGEPVGFRPLRENDSTLAAGETFITTTDPTDQVLAADGVSLRAPRPAERLARLKAARWEHIKGRRRLALDGGVAWNGRRWDTGDEHRNRLERTVSAWLRALALPPDQQAQLPGTIPATISWTTEDNVEVDLTVQQLAILAAVVALHEGTQFGIAKQLRAAINAATSAAEVAAVEWPT